MAEYDPNTPADTVPRPTDSRQLYIADEPEVAEMAAAADRYLADAKTSAFSHYELDPSARETLSQLRRHIEGMRTSAANAVHAAAKAAGDTMLYPEGRRSLMRAAVQDAESKIDTAQEAIESGFLVATAQLQMAARPTLRSAEAMTARHDSEMILSGILARGGDPVTAAAEMAGRQDAVGALMSTDWVNDWLTSRGVTVDDQLRGLFESIRTAAIFKGASTSADAGRRAAGRAGLALDSLRRAYVANYHASTARLATVRY